jgi:hypothetical protein
MGPRIYPSYQDTNINAKGSVIINFNDIILNSKEDFFEVLVNNQLRFTEYNQTEGLYSTNLNIGDVVIIRMTTSTTFFKSISVSRRDYTTDDTQNNGIIDTFIDILNNDIPTISYTFTATTLNNSYNFEYRIIGDIGTNPSSDCATTGFAADFDGNYSISFNDRRGFQPAVPLYYSYYYGYQPNNFPYGATFAPSYTAITSPIYIEDATLNYYGNIINYVVSGESPKYVINPYSFLDINVTPFSASTITFNPMLNWCKMDCSPDGKYQAVGQLNGSMFVSSNSGQTYSSVTSSTKAWKKIRMPNKDGFPFYAITETNNDYIYKIDSLSSFSILSANAKSTSGTTFSDFVVSRDGKYVVAALDDSSDTTMVSSDYGATFTSLNIGNFGAPLLGMSSTGKYVYSMSTFSFNPYIKKSSDYGMTWTNFSGPTQPPGLNAEQESINVSGTGKYIYVGTIRLSGTNNVFISQDYLNSYIQPYDTNQFNLSVIKPNKN